MEAGATVEDDLMEHKNNWQQRWVSRFLSLICPPELVEEIEGDLLQKYERHRKQYGNQKAARIFIWSALRFFRPGILLRNRFSFHLFNTSMIKNYITIALRNFKRQKSYTLLNVIGLSLGMAASLLIIQYVKYERSFDQFHTRARDIYRIQYNGWQNGQLNFESAVAVPAVGPALKNNFPEVEAYTRFLPLGAVISYEKDGQEPISFREDRGHFADTSLFKVFDFKLTQGDASSCLRGVDKMIISETLARKYFGSEEPIGKRLRLNGEKNPTEVTGVFQDVPENSHIKFDFLVSYETLNAQTENQSEASWGWYDFYSFVLLRPGTNVQDLQQKWDVWLAKDREEEWKRKNRRQEFILRPLTDIHLYSNLLYETSPQDLRDGDSVYALSFIALFILIIAWVNYINMATARSFKRANEVGVRKVAGAIRSQLVSQFLTESFLLNVIAACLAIGLVRVLWPSFSSLTGWNIPLTMMWSPDFWWLVIGLFFVGAILSGFYPAIILSSFKPVAVLKGKVMRSSGGNYLRKALVVFQFVASVFLISGSLIVYDQLKYMKNKDLGFDKNMTLVLEGPQVTDSTFQSKYDAFKSSILSISGVKGISASTNIPGVENYWTSSIERISGGSNAQMIVTHMGMDVEHVPQFGIKILAGRNFDKQYPDDRKKSVLINRSLAKGLEFKSPEAAIGVRVRDGRDTVEIVGVLEDYHQMSLKAAIIPVAFRLFDASAFFSVKIETQNYRQVLSAIESPWKTFFPGNPMDYFILDQFYNKQYERDDRFGQVFALFTGLAIFIASLGLVGLASFMAAQRTREIGIRKVLGSSVSGIITLLSRDFMIPVLIAIAIACPLIWWLMNKWLQSFPYHTTIGVWVFAASGVLVLLIAFITVSSQTLRAALTKPAETLKYE
jgi:putative ABC transport system permease protein